MEIMKLYNEKEDNILKLYSPCPSGKAYSRESVYQYTYPLIDASIIVPCYNAEQYLNECLNSIFKQQTKYHFEVIAVNDGSKDETASILADFQMKHSNLIVLTQENKGFSGARNTGIKSSRGKYLLFVDADDYIDGNYIQNLLDKAISNGCDIAACGYYSFRNNKIYKKIIPKNSHDRKLLNGCFWGKAFRRSLFEHIMLPEGYWYEDSILKYLVYPQIKSFASVEGCMYAYRSNPKGITITSKYKIKALDTFYITNLMIISVANFIDEKQLFEQNFYDQLIKQFYLNQCRISKLPLKCQKRVFELQSEFINKYYAGYKSNHRINTLYEHSLQKSCFLLSKILVKSEKVYKILNLVCAD